MENPMDKLTDEQRKALSVGYMVIATARLYIEKPDDPMFKRMTPKALAGVKRTAKALQSYIDKGEID